MQMQLYSTTYENYWYYFFCIGTVVLGYGIKQTRAYDNNVWIESFDECSVGSNISGTIYELYDNCYTGISKDANDGYWGVYDNKFIMFDVPYSYKNTFASLYNNYAYEYDLTESIGHGGGEEVDLSNGIKFYGKIVPFDKITFCEPQINNIGIELPETETSCFIRIYDEERLASIETYGIILIAVGIITFALAIIFISRKIDEYNDKLFYIT